MFPNVLFGTELDHERVCVVRGEVESQVPDEDVGRKLDDHQLVEQAHPLPHQYCIRDMNIHEIQGILKKLHNLFFMPLLILGQQRFRYNNTES